MSEIMESITADLSASMGAGRDAIIMTAIRSVSQTDALVLEIVNKGRDSLSRADLATIASRGWFEIYPDKTETFLWDNKPLIHFMPMEIKQENGRITASQPYRVVDAYMAKEGSK